MNLQMKRIRELAGLSQQHVADALCVPVRRYGSWEREERKINFEDAVRVAEILGCTTDELAGRSPSRTFADPRQESLNASYENMNERGKDTLYSVAKSMEKDTANRIVKDGQKSDYDQTAMGA